MNNSYAPDNTRTSLVIVLALAIVVALAAVLIGLSDKPTVDAIGISAGGLADASAAPNMSPDLVFDGDNDETASSLDPASSTIESAAPSSTEPAEEPTTEREIIVISTPEPTATAEVAPAVEPTPIPETALTDGSDAAAGPSLPRVAGTAQGTFFTKSDENEGAIVSQNEITLSFAEDGSGAFSGLLDITYADATHILLNMSGPLTWAPTNPQVETTLTGLFTLDAPITADDVTTDDADLSISSLEAGSGSLCITNTKCFGFTFPPQG